jgi:hypothetical protein
MKAIASGGTRSFLLPIAAPSRPPRLARQAGVGQLPVEFRRQELAAERL